MKKSKLPSPPKYLTVEVDESVDIAYNRQDYFYLYKIPAANMILLNDQLFYFDGQSLWSYGMANDDGKKLARLNRKIVL
jgi:hypothetical protein